MTLYERIASARSLFDRYLAGEPLPKLASDPKVCGFCGHSWAYHCLAPTFGGALACNVFVYESVGGRLRCHMCYCERNRPVEENKT